MTRAHLLLFWLLVLCLPAFASPATVLERAEQGDAAAQAKLGSMYYHGDEVGKDPAMAADWYRKAAEQGNAEAQYSLGILYGYGEGVPRDYEQAFKWFDLAARNGGPSYQLYLGMLFRAGKVVPRDFVLSYMWFNIAAASGDPEAQEMGAGWRDVVAKQMTEDQVAEAQSLAREWISPTPFSPGANTAKFLKARDGDSMLIEINNVRTDVRLIGVDAPEWKQEYGKQAKAFTTAFCSGDMITLEFDKSRYGPFNRLQAYVWKGGKMLNTELVRAGLALASPYRDNLRYRDDIHAAQKEAEAAKVGFWANGGLEKTPREYRRDKRKN